MRFRDLPPVVKTLVTGLIVAGAASMAWAIVAPGVRNPVPAAVYLLLSFLVASKRVPIHPRVATMSLGFVFVLGAVFTCGTGVAMAVAALNMLGCFFFPNKGETRQPVWVVGYNAASLAIAALAASRAYEGIMDGRRTSELSLHWASAAVAAVTVYFAASALFIGAASTLHRLRLPTRRWWQELLGTAPAFYAGGAIALALDAGYDRVGDWVLVVGVPFGLVLHLSFAAQAAKLKEEAERREATERLAQVYFSVVKALSRAIDVKDHYTHEHVQRVHWMARAVAQRLGLTGPVLEAVEFGAVLHDIGKLAIPDWLLRKPSRLSDAEFEVIKRHPIAGEAILKPVDFGSDVTTIVRYHHERLDGSGYPEGLAGEAIPIGARILAVIDVYDALIEDRPYRKAWTHEQAMAHLHEQAGTAFDPTVVAALADALADGAPEADPTALAFAEDAFAFAAEGPESGGPEETPGGADVPAALRKSILDALVRELVGWGRFDACVAFAAAERTGELEAEAASGPLAPLFARLRLPAGCGPSAQAGASGEEATDLSGEEDFRCAAEGCPPALRGSGVTAFPLRSLEGPVLAVVSFYSAARERFPRQLMPLLRRVVTVASRQLDALAGPEDDLSSPERLLAQLEPPAGEPPPAPGRATEALEVAVVAGGI
ncbi:MAG: HD-GYP domain-containing protein [Armatimonadetes bacterium]|nr:HD-GYP domain-containing protein [Armatimonadota bacterium]